MYREISYTSMIMSFTSFGTEIIYRAKLSNEETDIFYFVQSDLVVTLTIIQTLVSLYILRTLAVLTVFRMRLLNVFVDILLIAAIGLRAKYEFFKPLDSIKYSLYNITSFFLCIQAFTFALFWFYKGPYQEQEDTYSLRPPRRSRRHHNSSTPTVHRYDEEIDYTLPSYSEVPAPPAYTKTVVPNDEPVEDAETSSNNQQEDSALPSVTAAVENTDHIAIDVEQVATSAVQETTTENEASTEHTATTEHTITAEHSTEHSITTENTTEHSTTATATDITGITDNVLPENNHTQNADQSNSSNTTIIVHRSEESSTA